MPCGRRCFCLTRSHSSLSASVSFGYLVDGSRLHCHPDHPGHGGATRGRCLSVTVLEPLWCALNFLLDKAELQAEDGNNQPGLLPTRRDGDEDALRACPPLSALWCGPGPGLQCSDQHSPAGLSGFIFHGWARVESARIWKTLGDILALAQQLPPYLS